MNLNYPVDQYASHGLIDVFLVLHVFYFWLIIFLSVHIVLHYLACEFNHMLGVLRMLNVTIKNRLRHM